MRKATEPAGHLLDRLRPRPDDDPPTVVTLPPKATEPRSHVAVRRAPYDWSADD